MTSIYKDIDIGFDREATVKWNYRLQLDCCLDCFDFNIIKSAVLMS
jgi:hypothetical protein